MASLVTLETSLLANTQPLAWELLHRVRYFAYTASLSLLTADSYQRAALPVHPLPHLVQEAPAQCRLGCVQGSGRCPSS